MYVAWDNGCVCVMVNVVYDDGVTCIGIITGVNDNTVTPNIVT